MSQKMTVTFSHTGVCVANLERSIRFYTEALGFVLDRTIDISRPVHIIAELPEMSGRAAFLSRDGVTIELVDYAKPGVVGPAERRPMNQLGLTHMAFVVDDLDHITTRIEEFGGQAHWQTKVSTEIGELVFCTDPDGIRIELWNPPKS